MKMLRRLILGLGLLYIVFWAGLAAYFSYAEDHSGLLEANLSSLFKRPVTVQEVRTVWRGVTPRVQINGLHVAGDIDGQPALAFESLSASVSPTSLLRFWPRFTEFAIEKPVLEVASLENGQLQIAGVALSSKRRGPANPQRLLSWLLDQQAAAWHDGEIVWRSHDSDTRRYQNISFVYQRQAQARKIHAAVTTSKGPLAFTAQAQGDLLSDDQWDASIEILGDQGRRLLRPQDLSMNVLDGTGKLLLGTLDVARIRDFVRLAGLSNEARWLLESELEGRLHDVEFAFSGPLLSIDDWSLNASASDVGFKSAAGVPGMNELRGRLRATADDGVFEFTAEGSQFEWPQMFDHSFPITHAEGTFSWRIDARGRVEVSLDNGQFTDQTATIRNLHARGELFGGARRVSSFGELFTLESVSDLTYVDGELVSLPEDQRVLPLAVDVSAEFGFNDFSQLHKYLPNDKRIDKFRRWALNAFVSGRLTNGRVRYSGEISRNAIDVAKAGLKASAEFDNVTVDYGYQRDWPAVTSARGSASIDNELLTITPDEVWLNGDPVTDAKLRISKLFKRERLLTVEGKTSTSLVKGLDFLFKGPLIKPENRPEVLPFLASKGRADIQTIVEIPLNKVSDAKVIGQAEVSGGDGELPGGVRVEDIRGTVQFTERTVSSNDIRALFLGGDTRAKLTTVEPAQPPVVKLSASGLAEVDELEPWVGEHMLTWFAGRAPWQGELLVDGGRVDISGISNLEGVSVTVPAPLGKAAKDSARMALSMTVGGDDVAQSLTIEYLDTMQAKFQADANRQDSDKVPSLFDNALIQVGGELDSPVRPGVNFVLESDDINLDDWLSAVIDLASFEPQKPSDNTDFLDAMRSINIRAENPFFLGRDFGQFEVSASSTNGLKWVGAVNGENIEGRMQLEPRADIGKYTFNLTQLNLVDEPESDDEPEPIDQSLQPADYPIIVLNVDKFLISGKSLGRLVVEGRPQGEEWQLDEMQLQHNGITTTAAGGWKKSAESGSLTSFTIDTVVDEAEGALTDMDFEGIIKKGKGELKANISWIGAPHEFDYSRLNGEFDMRLKDGELVQVEPGSGKLLGLLNFNAIARRLVLDFSDVFASGLEFDRMRYTGLIADGEAIFRDAYLFSPAVFVRMEGKIDLDKELIDMEVHVSPELGGNLALLSALANPTAGAVVFITQRIFKDEMRASSFVSYRALGTWKDFEMVEIDSAQSSEPVAMQQTPADQSTRLNIEPSTNTESAQSTESSVNRPSAPNNEPPAGDRDEPHPTPPD